MTHKQFSSKGGKTLTPKKLDVLRLNAAKAREAKKLKNKKP